ncbi:MAG: hypothetical protein ABIO39_08225 [Caulobacteraceae bacterium]
MSTKPLLDEIAAFCRGAEMAETTFGRHAVNDGKFVSRLRGGGKVTPETAARVRSFIQKTPAQKSLATAAVKTPGKVDKPGMPALAAKKAPATPTTPPPSDEKNFRFYDNRQTYLMFVNTCSEKLVVARRIAQELENITPRPPALRLFDAGVGDGTVLTRVMRTMHQRFKWMPFYIVGKEISLEDVRLALEKMPDRFQEHPATVLVMTNLNYADAPWLTPNNMAAAQTMVWHEVGLQGDSAAEFDQQIADLEDFLGENWRASPSPKSGNPVYDKPVALIIYREDCKVLLDHILPRRGAVKADYDLVIASQPYRARASTAFKAKRVIAPLAKALGPGGRLIGIHSCGGDPALEIVQKVWPKEEPFATNRHDLLKATKAELGKKASQYNFSSQSDARALFRYDMHTLPGEIDAESNSIGTSTLFAAWNAATYVAQIEDQRMQEAMTSDTYLQATKDVLKKHGALWFQDEAFVITRKRDI